MAERGSSKRLSVQHEDYIARVYVGVRSPSSGGADTDQGDVRSKSDLIECKLSGSYGKPARSTLLKQFEKIALEAYAEARDPLLCLRFFAPDSVLANSQGWVDLAVRLVLDDAENVELARRYLEVVDR